MKVLKLNNVIANKIAGRLDKFNAIDPIFIKEDFFILPESLIRGLIERFPSIINKIKDQIKQGNILIIDLSKNTLDAKTVRALKNETDKQLAIRLGTRTISWDYTTKINEL